ncbi:hypothetical protein ACIBMX_46540 [Streptomyces phaeochromogenes]|uniref:hypothetical protein n=1 Tax=Streptomyces phaeochromogenes TaxID=1923 RepID=UPI003411DDF6|nr:hypothetical protein OG478_01935 [Streptomyces phaeochromogenes]WTA01443.1 hypothetical protein OHB08_03465 [Streptomyces phaeochromogenes]
MQFSEYGTSGVLRIVDLLGGVGSDVARAVDQTGEGVTVVKRAAGLWLSAPGRKAAVPVSETITEPSSVASPGAHV